MYNSKLAWDAIELIVKFLKTLNELIEECVYSIVKIKILAAIGEK